MSRNCVLLHLLWPELSSTGKEPVNSPMLRNFRTLSFLKMFINKYKKWLLIHDMMLLFFTCLDTTTIQVIPHWSISSLTTFVQSSPALKEVRYGGMGVSGRQRCIKIYKAYPWMAHSLMQGLANCGPWAKKNKQQQKVGKSQKRVFENMWIYMKFKLQCP